MQTKDQKNRELTLCAYEATKKAVELIDALNRHVTESADLCDGAKYEVTCLDMQAARVDAIMSLYTYWPDGSTTVHHYDVVIVMDADGGTTCRDYITGEDKL